MKKHLFGTALSILCLVMISSVASAQTDIDDIQEYTVAGVPASPFDGQSVTVVGQVTVPKGAWNTGTCYFQDATGGINYYNTGAATFNMGDHIEVTGTVGDYSGEINIGSSSPIFVSAGTPLVPVEYAMSALSWEEVGSLVSVVGVVTRTDFFGDPVNGGDLTLTSGADTLFIYVDDTPNLDLTSIDIGDDYMFSGILVNYNGLMELKLSCITPNHLLINRVNVCVGCHGPCLHECRFKVPGSALSPK